MQRTAPRSPWLALADDSSPLRAPQVLVRSIEGRVSWLLRVPRAPARPWHVVRASRLPSSSQADSSREEGASLSESGSRGDGGWRASVHLTVATPEESIRDHMGESSTAESRPCVHCPLHLEACSCRPSLSTRLAECRPPRASSLSSSRPKSHQSPPSPTTARR